MKLEKKEQRKIEATNNELVKIDGLTYRVELKASDCHAAYPFTWQPAIVWVRGYDLNGIKMYEEDYGFCSKKSRGPNSRCGQLLAKAQARVAELRLSPAIFHGTE